MENEDDLENKPTGLFGNMSNNDREAFSNIGERIIDIIDKNKASDEKIQNTLDEDLKKINSRDLSIYTNGLKQGLKEGKNIGNSTVIAFGLGIALGVFLSSKNKNS